MMMCCNAMQLAQRAIVEILRHASGRNLQQAAAARTCALVGRAEATGRILEIGPANGYVVQFC